jgi:Domain of unknown function (DUF6259)
MASSVKRIVLALALLVGAPAAAAGGDPPPRPRPAKITFDDRAKNRVVLTTPAYRLALAKRNGRVIELVDRAAGARVVVAANGCLWGAVPAHEDEYVGGCSYARVGDRRFSYRWDKRTATLTLGYRSLAERTLDALVVLQARRAWFDLRLTVRNRRMDVLGAVAFPADLMGDVGTVESGYAPTFLPGVRLNPSFFSRVGRNLYTYPSRWAFADYLALDAGGGHLSVSTVAPERPAPVELGFLHDQPAGACGGRSFCVVHRFQTWIPEGQTWTSPVVRVRVGATAESTIRAYRLDNGIDDYPSVASKLGPLLDTLARAPLVKADLPKLKPFRDWRPDLRRLPSPALVHPVAFQPRGHDENDPDFLPPDPAWGTNADFRAMIDTAHSLGLLVMPYLNVTWWDEQSPTVQGLPAPLRSQDVAVQNEAGEPWLEKFGENAGVVTSPHVPVVRERVAEVMEEWRTEMPVDCVFHDQLGARPWRRDFNPEAPNPLAYYDGWLELMAPYRDRCVMVEDGWDRLARDSVAFHGSMLMMQREHQYADRWWGEGTWEPYPLALWLLHDKVLLYQHDLFEGTMVVDPEVLTWNMAFGLVSAFSWNDRIDSLASPWLGLAGAMQQAVGPHYAGQPLTAYRVLSDRVTETAFGDLSVVANWNAEAGYTVDGHGVAPQGFLARTADDRLVAGAFAGTFYGGALSSGTHYLIVERGEAHVTVHQPLGGDTTLALDPPSAWRSGQPLRAVALGADGRPLGDAAVEVRDGRLVLQYAQMLGGRPVAGYRIG